VGLIHRTTLRVIVTVLLVAATLALLWLARRVFIVFLLAIFFAYLLEPVVAWFTRRLKGRRIYGIAATYAVLLIGLCIFGVTLGPQIANEAQRLVQTLPGMLEKVSTGQVAVQFGGQHGWSEETQVRVQRFMAAHKDEILQGGRDAAGHAASILSNVVWIVLIPVLAFFFLKDKSSFGLAALGAIDTPQAQGFVRSMINDLDSMLASYIRAQLLLSVFAAVAYTTFLLVMRFPYAFALGAIAGLLEFIPFVGPAITALLIIGVAFLAGYKHWLVVLAFIALWRLLQDYVNNPYLMDEGLELHPLLAIVGILVGGEIAGVIGMFLSIPVIAALRIFWRNWQLKQAVRLEVEETPPSTARAA
jgi:predicted PurR-regulated permease PerM